METEKEPLKVDDGKPGFTLRAVFIAVAMSVFLLTSSSYIALKLGALPWPIIFSVIIAGGLIKITNRGRPVNVHEINVAQAGASIGGLIAAGVVFTLPGILYLTKSQSLSIPWPDPFLLAPALAIAAILGVLLSVPLKYTFIDEEKLPFPAGMAGAELLKLGKTGGRPLFLIILVGSFAGVFALLRDLYFPAGFTIQALAAAGIFLTLLPMPLAVSGGYILGGRAGFSWLAGAVVGWMGIMPVLLGGSLEVASARSWVQNLGMGMVLGSGIGFFIIYVIPRLGKIFLPMLRGTTRLFRLFPVLMLGGAVVLWWQKVPLAAGILTLLGVWLMVTVAARMTGETNINPLEQFGIFVGLVIAFVYSQLSLELTMLASFLIVAFVSVASAVSGDAGHDYKSAAIVGTRFFDIVKIDIITAAVAGLLAPFVMEAIRRGFAEQLFTPAMPAPQAQLVASSIFGFEFPRVFLAGFFIAFFGEMFNTILPPRFKDRFLWMPFGIGLFLGLGLALPLALGAVIRVWVDRRAPNWYHSGLLLAAGVMGGEGIAGFTAGALTAVGWSYRMGAFVLIGLFTATILVSWRLYRRYRD